MRTVRTLFNISIPDSAASSTMFAIAIMVFGGCSKQPPETSDAPSTSPRVFVSNAPLKYFAERIGGDAVDVWYPIPAGFDPAFWEPDGDTVTAIQNCDAIILNGATYEKWLPTVTLPESKLHDTSTGFADDLIVVKDAVTHSHGPEGEHSHAGTAFTTWLDLEQAGRQAVAVKEALLAIAPGHAETFERNAAALTRELRSLDEELKGIGRDLADKPLLVSHPVYQYLARRYGLNIVTFHWEPDSVPDDAEWEHLAEVLQATPARFMLWEDTPLPASVDRLKTNGVESIVFAPYGNVGGDGDFLRQMRANVANLAKIAR